MVIIPSGDFVMGSAKTEKERDADEGPRHKVSIKSFALARFEVTFAQWDACFDAGGCKYRPKDQRWGRGKRAVVSVSWKDAQEYLTWLSKVAGKVYRLPSEAEWEYAARAGTQTRFWWGDAVGKNNANCIGCGSKWDGRRVAPVGSFKANPFGLFDMNGNAWEWVADCWHDNYTGALSDGRAWIAGGNCTQRIVRGGTWYDYPKTIRSADRHWFVPGMRQYEIGFRVARDLQ